MPRSEKYKPEEKELCPVQQALIQLHLQECKVCKASFDSYMKPIKAPGGYKEPSRIPQTPPCNKFLEGLKAHIDKCGICNEANKKWNEDSIPISENMRLTISKMVKGTATEEEMQNLRKELQEKLGVDAF